MFTGLNFMTPAGQLKVWANYVFPQSHHGKPEMATLNSLACRKFKE